MRTKILGLGRHLPPVADARGVSRPIAADPVGPSALAAVAAGQALEAAGRSVADVDFLVFATATPDVTFPGAGCYLQDRLGCDTVGALDVRGQCTGFLYGLMVADQFIRTSTYANILLAGAEVHSSGLDYDGDPETAALFGDGAGVALLGPGDERGLLAIDLHSDGSRYRDFWCEYPASRQHPVRFTAENLAAGGHFPKLDRPALQRAGAEQLESAMRRVLAAAGREIEAIDRFVVSHVLPDAACAAAAALGIGEANLVVPSQRYGHIMGAALPLALADEWLDGAVGPGATVCLAAAGAGETWGAAVLEL